MSSDLISSSGRMPTLQLTPIARDQAAHHGRRLLSLFSPRNGVDPQVYLTAIIGILAEYPEDIVVAVCDPVHGLGTKLQFMPTPKDVRDACLALWVPRMKQHHWYLHAEEQLASREYDKSAPRQSVAEIKAEMAKRGLDTSKWRE